MTKYNEYKIAWFNYQNAYQMIGNFDKPTTSPFSTPLTEEDKIEIAGNIADLFNYLAVQSSKVSQHLQASYFSFEHGMFHGLHKYEYDRMINS